MKFIDALKLRTEAKEIVKKGMTMLEMSPTAFARLFKAAKTYKLLRTRMENNVWGIPVENPDASDGASWHAPQSGSQCSLPDLSDDGGSTLAMNERPTVPTLPTDAPFTKARVKRACSPTDLSAPQASAPQASAGIRHKPGLQPSRKGATDHKPYPRRPDLTLSQPSAFPKGKNGTVKPPSADEVKPCHACVNRNSECIARYSRTDVQLICEMCLRRKTKCNHTLKPGKRNRPGRNATRTGLRNSAASTIPCELRGYRAQSPVAPTSGSTDTDDVSSEPDRPAKRTRITRSNASPSREPPLLPNVGYRNPTTVMRTSQLPGVTSTASCSPSPSFIADILFPFSPNGSPKPSMAPKADSTSSDSSLPQAAISTTTAPLLPHSLDALAPTHHTSPPCEFHFHEMAHSYWNFARLTGLADLHIDYLEQSIRNQQELLYSVRNSQAHLSASTRAMFESMRAFIDPANQASAAENFETGLSMVDMYGQLTTQLFNRFQQAYEDGTLGNMKEEDIADFLVLRDQ